MVDGLPGGAVGLADEVIGMLRTPKSRRGQDGVFGADIFTPSRPDGGTIPSRPFRVDSVWSSEIGVVDEQNLITSTIRTSTILYIPSLTPSRVKMVLAIAVQE